MTQGKSRMRQFRTSGSVRGAAREGGPYRDNPFSGEPLLRELTGLWKYKVRRFRLIYEVDRKARLIRILALGHRREVYEELTDRLREARRCNK